MSTGAKLPPEPPPPPRPPPALTAAHGIRLDPDLGLGLELLDAVQLGLEPEPLIIGSADGLLNGPVAVLLGLATHFLDIPLHLLDALHAAFGHAAGEVRLTQLT